MLQTGGTAKLWKLVRECQLVRGAGWGKGLALLSVLPLGQPACDGMLVEFLRMGRGRLMSERLGPSDDFPRTELPEVLENRRHPASLIGRGEQSRQLSLRLSLRL